MKTLRIWMISAVLAGCSLPLARAQPSLRWAADSESGAPFAFQDPKNPNDLKGFEVEIVQAIAAEIGRKAVFVQNSWDGLIPGLNRENYDVAVNGLEITEDRKQEVLFSDPYYVTYEQLVVRKDETRVQEFDDVRFKVVGTLKFSLAHRMLEAKGSVEIRTYEAETNAFADLKNGRLDAVFLDAPITLYYAKPDPELKLVGAPVGQVFYGIAVRKKNADLRDQVNRALRKIKQDGKLREIYERWNLWNPLMATAFGDSSVSRTQPTEYEAFLESRGQKRDWLGRLKLYSSFMPLLMKGALITMEISILSMLIAMVLGLVLALARLYGPTPVQYLTTLYIEIIRGTPLLIQLFLIFYALPHLGIKLTPFFAAIIGLGLNYAAYEAENYRAGLQSVPKGQTEAGLALGMSPTEAIRNVVLPQAIRNVIPPITNDFISLLKDSSLVSVITMVELTKVYGQLASTYYDYLGTGLIVAGIYLLLGLPFVRLARRLEIKYTAHRRLGR